MGKNFDIELEITIPRGNEMGLKYLWYNKEKILHHLCENSFV